MRSRENTCPCVIAMAMLMTVPTMVGCRKAGEGNLPGKSSHVSRNSAPRQEADEPNPTRKAVIETWRRIASEHGVPDDTVNRVAILTADVLGYVGPSVTAGSMEALQASLQTYLPHQASAFEGQAKGLEYWLAYCIGRAFERAPAPRDDDCLVHHYQEIVADASRAVEEGVLASLPLEQRRAMTALVREGGAHLRRECGVRIQFYVGDFLCPGFKRELSATGREAALEKYHDRSKLPELEEPTRMMVSAEEEFRQKYKNFIENEIGLLLFDLFIRSLDTRLGMTDYWGYMKFSALSEDNILTSPTIWPVAVRFVPDDVYNAKHQWKRNH
jgi:hypothetical protein